MSNYLNVAKNTIVANVYKGKAISILVVIGKEKTGNLTKCYNLFGDGKETFRGLYKDSYRVATKKDIVSVLSETIYWNKLDSYREKFIAEMKGF